MCVCMNKHTEYNKCVMIICFNLSSHNAFVFIIFSVFLSAWFCVSVCLFLHVSVCLSLSVCLCLCSSLSHSLSVCLSLCLTLCRSLAHQCCASMHELWACNGTLLFTRSVQSLFIFSIQTCRDGCILGDTLPGSTKVQPSPPLTRQNYTTWKCYFRNDHLWNIRITRHESVTSGMTTFDKAELHDMKVLLQPWPPLTRQNYTTWKCYFSHDHLWQGRITRHESVTSAMTTFDKAELHDMKVLLQEWPPLTRQNYTTWKCYFRNDHLWNIRITRHESVTSAMTTFEISELHDMKVLLQPWPPLTRQNYTTWKCYFSHDHLWQGRITRHESVTSAMTTFDKAELHDMKVLLQEWPPLKYQNYTTWKCYFSHDHLWQGRITRHESVTSAMTTFEISELHDMKVLLQPWPPLTRQNYTTWKCYFSHDHLWQGRITRHESVTSAMTTFDKAELHDMKVLLQPWPPLTRQNYTTWKCYFSHDHLWQGRITRHESVTSAMTTFDKAELHDMKVLLQPWPPLTRQNYTTWKCYFSHDHLWQGRITRHESVTSAMTTFDKAELHDMKVLLQPWPPLTRQNYTTWKCYFSHDHLWQGRITRHESVTSAMTTFEISEIHDMKVLLQPWPPLTRQKYKIEKIEKHRLKTPFFTWVSYFNCWVLRVPLFSTVSLFYTEVPLRDRGSNQIFANMDFLCFSPFAASNVTTTEAG